MIRNSKIIRETDDFLEGHSKKYFIYKKLKKYKEKLQQYRHVDLKQLCKYEKRWQRLSNKYKQINLYGIQLISIGETVARLFNVLEDLNNKDKEILYVILPIFYDRFTGGIFNRRLFDVFGKKIYFIKDSNIDFWTYILFFHAKDVHIEQFDKYRWIRLGAVKVTLNEPLLPFTEKENLEGESKLKKMGVNREFICLHARESNVKKVNFSKHAEHETSCRSCDIGTFMKTSQYFFKTFNIQSVRLGKYETQICNEESVIDYANKYYDEFMDFYLLSRCKFLISCDTGIAAIGGYWGRPVLATNMTNICYGGESWPDTGYIMYIPKKFYSRKEKRYLNLYEMLDVMSVCYYTSNFSAKGIILEDNTEDEILEAAIEMNARLEHLWVEFKEEKENYEKYWKIMHCWQKRHKRIKVGQENGYTMYFCELSYSYLTRNLYLLDVDSSLLW